MGTTPLGPYGRAYVGGIIAAGLWIIGWSVLQLHLHPLPWQWFLLAALTLLSGSATVRLPSVPASLSISETFVFTAVLLYGTDAGTLIVALDGLAISFWIAKRRHELYRALFNTCAPAVSVWFSARLFFYVSNISPLVVGPTSLDRILPALGLFAATYFCLNTWLITFAIVAETHLHPLSVWRYNFFWLSLNYFFGASLAFLLVIYTRDIDVRYIGVIVPLLLVLYFTFKNSSARVEDANRHVEQVDRLYLSTIETLAMAIDAKDQVTHGHIRRVQAYAVGLAHHIGITDKKLIRAIEAAALLHDMGKLAVPEYILNKPGKLTAAEFEKMKLHASVGADILSAIDFPYPVVPIVRHHHEHWDGHGYPDSLKGIDIPIGARILAVVDCFDALTSDRPYRRRLSDSEALRIVIERRGSMYDPLIVDTFARMHKGFAPAPIPIGPASEALEEIASSIHTKNVVVAVAAPQLDDITSSADEMLTMYELARALAGPVSVIDVGNVVANHLRRWVPFSLCVLYLYEPLTDELEATYATGDSAFAVKGLKIPLGEHLSGWVAANRQTILNSDPVLDLGEVARLLSPRLRKCLSTALITDEKLVGVLTLYVSGHDGFSEDHRRILEAVASPTAETLKRAAERDTTTNHDALTGLPNLTQLETLGQRAVKKQMSHPFMLFIEVKDLPRINMLHGRQAGDDVLRHVVERTRSALRPTDLLFRSGGDEFVALLDQADSGTASSLAEQVCENVGQHPLALGSRVTIRVDITTTITTPQDGVTLRELATMARSKTGRQRSSDRGRTVH